MDKTLIATASRALTPRAVWLRNSQVRCEAAFLPQIDAGERELVPQYRVADEGRMQCVSVSPDPGGEALTSVLFDFEAAVRLVAGDPPDPEPDVSTVLVEIVGGFCAEYLLAAGADAEALGPALAEFGQYNVGYHVWPFWREYVQTTCARMGLPPIPIPFYRLTDEAAPEPLASDD